MKFVNNYKGDYIWILYVKKTWAMFSCLNLQRPTPANNTA